MIGGAERRLMMGLVLKGSQDPNPMLMCWLGHQEWCHMLMEGDLGLRGRLLEQVTNHPRVEGPRSVVMMVQRRTRVWRIRDALNKARLEENLAQARQQALN